MLSWAGWTPLESGGYVYPYWANVVGWCIAIIIIAMVPLGFLFDIIFIQKGDLPAVSPRDAPSRTPALYCNRICTLTETSGLGLWRTWRSFTFFMSYIPVVRGSNAYINIRYGMFYFNRALLNL